MEVIQANLPLNTFAERDDFEAEIDAITDSTDGETEEPCRDDDKVNRLVERQRLVKEVARAQTFWPPSAEEAHLAAVATQA